MIASMADVLESDAAGRPSRLESQGTARIKGFPTGLTDIDRWTGGLMPGRIHVVAARPGAGLSSVLRTMVVHTVLMNLQVSRPGEDVTTLFFTRGYDVGDDAMRIHEAVSWHIADDDDNPEVKDSLGETKTKAAHTHCPDDAASMADYRLAFSATDDLVEIIGEVLAFRARHPHERLLVVLDNPSFVGRSNPHHWALAGPQLLHLAKTANAAFVVGTLLSKRIDSMSTARQSRPLLVDVENFGQIAENSEVVIAIYRADYYDDDSIDKGMLTLNVIRNHEGKLGAKRFVFLGERSLICNLIEPPEEMFNSSDISSCCASGRR